MRTLQVRHWWWKAMGYLYRCILGAYLPTVKDRRILDIGSGYGANFDPLRQFGTVIGVDISLTALRQTQRNVPGIGGLVQARMEALPFRAGSFDVVAVLAVIEHVERDKVALLEARRVTCVGGLQLLLTSAFMALWSHHDVANRHYRRYLSDDLARLEVIAGWRVLLNSYVNTTIFLQVLLIRTMQRLLNQLIPAQRATSAAYDMGPEGWLINALLQGILRVETWLVVAGLRLPFGVDLIIVAQREADGVFNEYRQRAP